MLEEVAVEYNRVVEQPVEIEVTGMSNYVDLSNEIMFDASTKSGQFDGYIFPQTFFGGLASQDALFELTEFSRSYSRNPDWFLDILLFIRESLSVYDQRLLLMPFDGDVLSLFYRKDLFQKYNVSVPKTWDEYIQAAAVFDGKQEVQVNSTTGENETITLAGHCMPAVQHCLGYQNFVHGVLASMTQTKGFATGALFDTKDMSPLLGEAMEETLRIFEELEKVSTGFESREMCSGDLYQEINAGRCVMTLMWGGVYTEHNREGSHAIDNLGTDFCPGSTKVLDRETGKLVPCTMEICPYAVPHVSQTEGKVLVNFAPYGGGLSAAVSNYVSSRNQAAAADFLAFASDTGMATRYVIPVGNVSATSQNVYRKSMLNDDIWVSRGYSSETSAEYLQSISDQLLSENVVLELRIPTATDILFEFNLQVPKYLNESVWNPVLTDEQKPARRAEISRAIGNTWMKIINDYDALKTTKVPIHEIYLRSRGVYVPPEGPEGTDTSIELGAGAIVGIVLGVAAFVIIVAYLIGRFLLERVSHVILQRFSLLHYC
jgi:multiple sugar transport system substrate-binding protein